MSDASELIEGVKAHLRELGLEQRCRLLRRVETARLEGTSEPAHHLIVNALRAILQEEHDSAQRVGTPMRIFCEALEPYLVDESGSTKHRGFICRRSLNRIWRWIGTQAGADGFARSEDEATRALIEGDYARARDIAAQMRVDVLPILDAALARATEGERYRMQLAMELEGGRGLDDLRDIASVLRLEGRLCRLAHALPERIGDLSPDLVASITPQLDFDDNDLVYPLVLIHRRLTNPSQILQIMVRCEQTDDGARLARSRFAECARIVLADIELSVERMARHVGRPGDFEALIAAIHRFYTLASGFAVAVDLDGVSQWRSGLAELRRRACEIVTTEITRVPGTVRRALKPRRGEGHPLAMPDAGDVEDAELACRLMVGLRPYRAELAVNDLLAGVVRHVENFVEAANNGVLQELRDATAEDRTAARTRFETALRLNRIVFGHDYAALVERSGQLAARPGASSAEIPPVPAPAA